MNGRPLLTMDSNTFCYGLLGLLSSQPAIPGLENRDKGPQEAGGIESTLSSLPPRAMLKCLFSKSTRCKLSWKQEALCNEGPLCVSYFMFTISQTSNISWNDFVEIKSILDLKIYDLYLWSIEIKA